MDITRPDWSSIPDDLLAKIGKKLHTRLETLRFRSVCASFRSSTPLPPQVFSPALKFPMVDLIKSLFDPFAILSFFGGPSCVSLFESTVYAIEPLDDETLNADDNATTKTWIFTVEEVSYGKFLLNHPLPPSSFQNLSLRSLDSLNLLDYRVKEITKEYKLGGALGPADEFLGLFRKVVVSSCLDEIDDGFAMMIIYDNWKLGIWRNEDKKWTKMGNTSGSYFVDAVYHNKKFYALDFLGSVIAVDPESLNVNKVADPLPSGIYSHLLKVSKDLLLIEIEMDKNSDDEPYSLSDLIVYKLDEENCTWVRVMNELEDKMVFLRPDCSFALLAEEVSECKRNCVYYLKDDSMSDARVGNSRLNAGFFDLKNHKAGPFSDFPDYSKFLWPPPSWLK